MPKNRPSDYVAPVNARRDRFLTKLGELTSPRKVRPVVTRSGHRARGYFCTFKASRARYESLLELDALHVLEAAPRVLEVRTHPVVMQLPHAHGLVHYTPDVIALAESSALIIEVKADYFLRQVEGRIRLNTVATLMKGQGLPFAVLLESDLRSTPLVTELRALLRQRPAPGRYRDLADGASWDPRGQERPSDDLLRRWKAAQQECDALLERVMQRPLGDVLDRFEP